MTIIICQLFGKFHQCDPYDAGLCKLLALVGSFVGGGVQRSPAGVGGGIAAGFENFGFEPQLVESKAHTASASKKNLD